MSMPVSGFGTPGTPMPIAAIGGTVRAISSTAAVMGGEDVRKGDVAMDRDARAGVDDALLVGSAELDGGAADVDADGDRHQAAVRMRTLSCRPSVG